MRRVLDTAYGLGRLAFGGGLLVAPDRLGAVLVGDDARQPAVRATLRIYGSRDTVLGLGTLRAVYSRGDVPAWLAAGVASDLLDAGVQAREWESLPPDKRLAGTLLALGAAAAGAAMLHWR